MLGYRKGGTVDDEVVELTPGDFLQELLDESVLSGSSPNHSVIRIIQQKANRHDRQVIHIHWRPPFGTLMNLMANQSQHRRYARPTDVHVK